MSEPNEAEYAAQQAAEYGTYVAVGPIYFEGARAFNAGHPVPTSHVEKYGYLTDGLVRKTDDPTPTPAAVPVVPQGDPININTEKG